MLKPEKADPKGTKYFRYTYELDESKDPNEGKEERLAYLNGLLSEGKLRAAGTYENSPLAGLTILSVPSREDAEAIAKEDPIVKNNGASYQIIEWDPKFGDFK